ncbi:hypothetical protein AAFF_G00106380 [Aldrovandia affinis]|uniref:Uncharacterized protein n=1 Tax=Aldrovandia affinis TaxID=143900 RepID=A0AAD7T2C0_9TELE|nr:hypothetical protein AAFF_G00106380 [Aldrovandia affinis]
MKTIAIAIFVLLSTFAGIILYIYQHTYPLQIRTDDISTRDVVEMRMEPLFDPDFQESDDYGVEPFPPRMPPFLVHGEGPYEPNLDKEYY